MELPFSALIERCYPTTAALIVGCGPSAGRLSELELELIEFCLAGGRIIVVNDAARFVPIHPDVLLILDVLDPELTHNPLAFTEERAQIIRETAPRVGTFYWEPILASSCPGPRCRVQVQGHSLKHDDLLRSEFGTLPRGISSVPSAIGLAYAMGARRIGVIGSEFTGHRYMELEPTRSQLGHIFVHLGTQLLQEGATLHSLAPDTRINLLPYAAPTLWLMDAVRS